MRLHPTVLFYLGFAKHVPLTSYHNVCTWHFLNHINTRYRMYRVSFSYMWIVSYLHTRTYRVQYISLLIDPRSNSNTIRHWHSAPSVLRVFINDLLLSFVHLMAITQYPNIFARYSNTLPVLSSSLQHSSLLHFLLSYFFYSTHCSALSSAK